MSDTSNGTSIKQFQTTIRCERSADGSWKATEPAGSGKLFGRGDSPPEAVENYAQALRERDDEQE